MIFWCFGTSGMYYVTFKVTYCYTLRWPPRSMSYPWLFYKDHMDNLPAANPRLASLPVVFLPISVSWCSMSPSGTYIYSRELYFWNDKLEHPVPVHHPLAFQLSPWVLQNRRSFLFLRGLTPNIFLHVYQAFLSSLPSHSIQMLWYLCPFSHILGNVLDSPLLPVATIWQNHSPGEIQTFFSYLHLDSRSYWREWHNCPGPAPVTCL